MPRSRGTPDDVEMIAAAYLAGQNRRQIEIAAMLGISQAAVSRYLSRARHQYLREEVRFLGDTVPPETMQRVLQRVSRNKLSERLERFANRMGRRAPLLRVFTCATHSLSEAAAKEESAAGASERNSVRWKRMAELSRQAAPYIRDLILRSRNCGVTWGGMLSQMAVALQELSIAPPWREDQGRIEIIPLSGEPLGDQPTTYSSSSIAHSIGLAANGADYNAPSLAMVPAFIPDNFEEAQRSGVWRLIRLVPAYAQIFGKVHRRQPGEQPLIDNLDMVLTSVGPATRPLGFGRGRLFATGNLKMDDMQKLVIGDMGGVCFERPGLTEAQRGKLDGVAERWTGWRREHLDRCASRANGNDPFHGPPGIVIASVGRERAEFLLSAVAAGCVNHLIVDDELCAEMEKLLLARETEAQNRPDK